MATPSGAPVTGLVSGLSGTVEDFNGPLAAPVTCALANPQRLYLIAMFSSPTGRVSPAPGSQTFGFGPDVGGSAGGRLIHHLSFPGVCQGEWYFFDPGGGSCRVYDIDRPENPGQRG